jgi:monoamine oxidase
MQSVILVCLIILCGSLASSVDPYSKAAYVPAAIINNVDYRADACIIGAGFAGVKAAEQFQVRSNSTLSWLLVERSGRIGGRVETAVVGTGNNTYHVERHAQWIQGNLGTNKNAPNPVLQLAVEMQPPLGGGNSKWSEYYYFDGNGVRHTSGGSIPELTRLWSAYACVYDDLMPLFLNGSLADMSITDCYALCGFYARSDFEFSLRTALIDVEWGELNEITSCANSGYWVAYSFYGDDGANTPNFVADQRGLSSVAEYILRRKGILLNDSRIHYNTEVTNVNTDTNVITATKTVGHTTSTVKYQCKIIIDTMSIGVHQASLRENTNLVTPLPSIQVQASLHKYHMAEYQKIFLQYKTKFWGDRAHFVLTPRDKEFQVTSWTSMDDPLYYPGSRILLVSYNGPQSNMEINMQTSEYVRRITQELEFVFGSAANFANLTENGYYVGQDTYDPELRGCYSNRPPTLSEDEFRNMWAPVKGRYIPSGEAACDLLNGYVVGAYHIGGSAALRAMVNLGVLAEGSVNPEDNECFRPPPGWSP